MTRNPVISRVEHSVTQRFYFHLVSHFGNYSSVKESGKRLFLHLYCMVVQILLYGGKVDSWSYMLVFFNFFYDFFLFLKTQSKHFVIFGHKYNTEEMIWPKMDHFHWQEHTSITLENDAVMLYV